MMKTKTARKIATIEVSGGLGNQFFQLGAALFLRSKGMSIRLDLKPNELNGKRENDIQDLAASLGFIPFERPVTNREKIGSIILRRIFQRVQMNVIREIEEFGCPPVRFSRWKVVYRGYWQCTDVAIELKESIISYLGINAHVKRETIALHIRRGDYMVGNNPNFHGVLAGEYFLNAVNYLRLNLGNLPVVIYSDSPDYVRTESWLPSLVNYSFAEEMSTLETFKSISSSVAIVGSNSTFSWWAAYISGSPHIIFPTLWQVGLDLPETLRFDGMILLKSSFL
jgi:hypothetical protein